MLNNMEQSKQDKVNANSVKDEKIYDYNEAIELAGNGCYIISLMVILSISLLAMCLDMFSFSIIVTYSSCDFDLDLAQKSLLLSIPFMGPVIMAYAWGYICDTKGRKKSLLVAMVVSYLMSSLCAFSPNWIILAIFKLISTCFCSCAQSAAFTLLGESCPERLKGTYLLFTSSTVHLGSATYFTLSYFVGNMHFSYDLGFITFVPWRFLVLILALPLGITALSLLFFYESPKFLINAGREEEALEILRNICRRNGGDMESYPVKKVVLNEVGNLKRKDIPLLKSMWEQTAPLFKPPLLKNTLQLYYITFIIYSTNSGLYSWLPSIAKAFTASADSSAEDQGLCDKISLLTNETTGATCITSLDPPIVIAAAVYGSCACLFNLLMSKLATRKRLLMVAIVSFSAFSCLATKLITHHISNFFYFGVLTTSICLGLISSYFVELYPTSFRGMAACLGVMMARLSSVIGINIMGPFLTTQCAATFYIMAALLFSAVAVSFLLPADRKKKVIG